MEHSNEFDEFVNDKQNLELVPIEQVSSKDVVYFYGRNYVYRIYDHCLYPTKLGDHTIQYIKLSRSVTHLWRNKVLTQLNFNFDE